MFTINDRPHTQFGYSWHHDIALRICQASANSCPFGCAKDGAPNCAQNVSGLRCEPARQAVEQAQKLYQQMRLAKQAHLEMLTKDQLPRLLERRDTVLESLFATLDSRENDKLLSMLEWLEEQISYPQEGE